MSRSALVFCGGDAPSGATMKLLSEPDLVIAADSGTDHALGLSIQPDIAVGDFDSVTADGLAAAEAAGARIERHPDSKDETDFELALRRALAENADEIVVVGIDGGRLDHQLANILLLASSWLAKARVKAYTENETITVVRSSSTFEGTPGAYLSLIPIAGDVTGITTTGLSYPLNDETLLAASSRGISNKFAASTATVSVSSGVLLAIETRS